jgi:heme a synthase
MLARRFVVRNLITPKHSLIQPLSKRVHLCNRSSKDVHVGLRKFSTSNASEIEKPVAKSVGYWLLGMSGLVAGMVSIGGITRLTKSGLSMTDWKLQGTIPPMNLEEWNKEFDRYKQYPEWQQRKNMTLDEFKYIFFWEWGHRMMGRSLGIAFALPFLVFLSRGMIPRRLLPRMGLLFTLGGTQGLIGWWMVKSGLDKATIIGLDQNKEIRVSPYRLATHLGMAFTTFVACFWTSLEILKPTTVTVNNVINNIKQMALTVSAASTSTAASGTATAAVPASKAITHKFTPESLLKITKNIRRLNVLNIALVATTVMSGAYVAGNDAGNAYNTFPKMGDEWIPSGMYSLDPIWRNFFENTATVQFDHRILALSTLTSIGGMFILARRGGNGLVWNKVLPSNTKKWITSVAYMSIIQVGLGITTLLTYVPIQLAATHQLGSLVLLALSTGTLHSLRFVKVIKPSQIMNVAKKVAV